MGCYHDKELTEDRATAKNSVSSREYIETSHNSNIN